VVVIDVTSVDGEQQARRLGAEIQLVPRVTGAATLRKIELTLGRAGTLAQTGEQPHRHLHVR
jgi:hypothetical protein